MSSKSNPATVRAKNLAAKNYKNKRKKYDYHEVSTVNEDVDLPNTSPRDHPSTSPTLEPARKTANHHVCKKPRKKHYEYQESIAEEDSDPEPTEPFPEVSPSVSSRVSSKAPSVADMGTAHDVIDPTRFSMNLISQLSKAKSSRGLTPETLQHLENVFRQTCGTKGEIGLQEFKKIIQSKNEFFAERMFKMFDTDSSGTISLEEFLAAMRRFSTLSPVEKLRHVFAVYDIDGDGAIQLSEMRSVIKECMKENNLSFSESETESLAYMLFKEADVDNSGAINFDEFKEQLSRHPGLIENLSMSVEHWLIPPMPKKFGAKYRPRKLSWKYIRNNLNSVCFLIAFLSVLVGLFASRLVQYYNTNGYFMVARGCAQCLNFLCAFVLACVLRRTITILRVQGLSEFLPLDSHIYFHKLAGVFVFIFSMTHTLMHILNFAYISKLTSIPLSTLLIDQKFDIGWVGGAACLTGWIMFSVLILMFLSSLPCVRRNEYFEVFYYVHLLYFAFFVLLVLHGGNFWKWLLLPGTIFIIELLIRAYRFISPSTSVSYVEKAVLLPSKVTHLVIKRPSHFIYHPGDYIFVNIPQIAKHEWHPFTISSAPEEDGVIWLHIRGTGNWTNSLYTQFQKVTARAAERPQTDRLDSVDSSGYTNVLFDQNDNPSDGNQPVVLRTITRNLLQRELSLGLPPAPPAQVTTSLTAPSSSEGSLDTTPPEIARHSSPPGLDVSLNPIAAPVAKTTLQPPMKQAVRHTMSSPDGRRQLNRGGTTGSVKVPALTPGRSLRRVFSVSQRPSLNDIGQALRRYRKKKTDEDSNKRKRNIIYLKTENDEEASITSIKSYNTRRLSPSSIGSFGDSYVQLRDEGEAIYWNNRMQIRLDGPYGSPSSHIFNAQHAVLIATGIGVTPFASILQSIVHRYKKSHHSCPWCQQTWVDTIPSNIMNLKKVDFFWINRNQDAFEWFVSLLGELEVEQAKMAEDKDRFLDIHMYITSALHKNDMKALGLQIALDLLHDKEKRDLITGLKTRTKPGRPNWDEVFAQISREKKGKVTVFFCGPAEVGRLLHTKCNDFGFTFKKEIF